MDAETVLAAARHQFAEENHFVSHFLYRNIEILDSWKRGGKFIQFMVMGGKECLGPCRRVAVKKLRNSPGDRYAVVGAGTPPDLVEQDKAALGKVVHDTGRFVHLDHECRFAGRQVIRSTHTSEYLVYQSNPGFFCRHE